MPGAQSLHALHAVFACRLYMRAPCVACDIGQCALGGRVDVLDS